MVRRGQQQNEKAERRPRRRALVQAGNRAMRKYQKKRETREPKDAYQGEESRHKQETDRMTGKINKGAVETAQPVSVAFPKA